MATGDGRFWHGVTRMGEVGILLPAAAMYPVLFAVLIPAPHTRGEMLREWRQRGVAQGTV